MLNKGYGHLKRWVTRLVGDKYCAFLLIKPLISVKTTKEEVIHYFLALSSTAKANKNAI